MRTHLRAFPVAALMLVACGGPRATFDRGTFKLEPIRLTAAASELQPLATPYHFDPRPIGDAAFVDVVHDLTPPGGAIVRRHGKDGSSVDLLRVACGAAFDPTLLVDGRLFVGIYPCKEPARFVSVRPGAGPADVRTLASGTVRGVVSQDGAAFAFERAGKVWVSSLEAASPLVVGEGGEPSLSPTGRWLAYVASSGQIVVFDATTSESHALGEGRSPAWSPTGDALVVLRKDDVVRIGADGSGPTVLARAPKARRVFWTSDDAVFILRERLYRFVPHPAGSPAVVPAGDPAR